jgi:REP element-mobilizing transposase RayT
MSETISGHPKLWYSRGYLPHFDGGEIIQFITFRLADSLPQNVLEQWEREIERDLISEVEFHRKLEKYLDNGYGNCYLKNEQISSVLIETLEKFDGEKYKLFAWVIMPNHVHLLLRPEESISLAEIMHSIKSYTSHEANKILKRKGRFWSKEYFDRFIRNQEHFVKTFDYIENNPVKAGLCKDKCDWKFSSAFISTV